MVLILRRLRLALLLLFVSQVASAQLKDLLREYTQLEHDSALIITATQLLESTKLYHPKQHTQLDSKSQSHSWTYLQYDFDYTQWVINAASNLSKITSKIYSEPLRERFSRIINPLRTEISFEKGAGLAEFWENHQKMIELIFKNVTSQLKEVSIQLEKKKSKKITQIETFVNQACQADPHCILQELSNELEQLEFSIQSQRKSHDRILQQIQDSTQSFQRIQSEIQDAEQIKSQCLAQLEKVQKDYQEQKEELVGQLSELKKQCTQLDSEMQIKKDQFKKAYYNALKEISDQPKELSYRIQISETQKLPLALRKEFHRSLRTYINSFLPLQLNQDLNIDILATVENIRTKFSWTKKRFFIDLIFFVEVKSSVFCRKFSMPVLNIPLRSNGQLRLVQEQLNLRNSLVEFLTTVKLRIQEAQETEKNKLTWQQEAAEIAIEQCQKRDSQQKTQSLESQPLLDLLSDF